MRAPLLPVSLLALALLAAACAPERARMPSPQTAGSTPANSARGKAPPPKPVWQARKVVADAVAVPGGRLHTVKPGETGIAIARAYGVSWTTLINANKLKPPYVLQVGDKLMLPTRQQVAQMTLEQRAQAFDLDIDDLITGGEPAANAPARARPAPGQPPRRTAAATARLPEIPGDAPAFRWPVEGRILSGYGAKSGGRFNDGVNLKASAGTPVRAAGDGVIAYAGDAIPGFGNLVLIKHASGYVTAYGHNEALLVERGRSVRQGDIIARAGDTGAVTEPQVHFEIRKGRTALDPARLIGGR